jgi:hypothetical protein
MLGFKGFRTAAVVISGVELAEKIKKGQFKTGKLGGRMATLPELWRAALAVLLNLCFFARRDHFVTLPS